MRKARGRRQPNLQTVAQRLHKGLLAFQRRQKVLTPTRQYFYKVCEAIT